MIDKNSGFNTVFFQDLQWAENFTDLDIKKRKEIVHLLIDLISLICLSVGR